MSEPNFGPLGGLVRRCERRRRPAKVMLLGPNSSGKTLSAIRLAAGLVGEGGTIALLSCGEAASEEIYAEWATFYHVDALAPATVELVRKATKGGRMVWDASGTDPRVALYAAKALVQGVGPNGVVVIDSASDIWEGVKARVDVLTGGDKKMNGPAWQQATPVLDAFWDVLEQAVCHVIVCVRCKSEAALEEREGEKVPVHYPTSPEMRERDRFRFDVRIYLDTLHRARFEGRLDVLNGKTVPILTEDVGRRFAALLDGPAGQPRLVAPDAAVEPTAAVAEGEKPAPAERADAPHPRLLELAEALAKHLPKNATAGALLHYLAASGKATAATKEAARVWADSLDPRGWDAVGGNIKSAITRRLADCGAATDPTGLTYLGTDHAPEAAAAGLQGDPKDWPKGAAWGVGLAARSRLEKTKVPPGEAALRKALEVPGGEEAVRRALRQVGAPWPTEDNDKGELAYIIEKNCQASAGPEDTVALLSQFIGQGI